MHYGDKLKNLLLVQCGRPISGGPRLSGWRSVRSYYEAPKTRPDTGSKTRQGDLYVLTACHVLSSTSTGPPLLPKVVNRLRFRKMERDLRAAALCQRPRLRRGGRETRLDRGTCDVHPLLLLTLLHVHRKVGADPRCSRGGGIVPRC